MQATLSKKIKIGIFFGGRSREREISFAGGRTVYDNLDKTIFEPIPIFVDSLGNFILLDWQYLYRGSIRDFYPPKNTRNSLSLPVYIESLVNLDLEAQTTIINQVGRRLTPDEFSDFFDFAFLALHGLYGEDGTLQGLLEWYQIPYSGSGLLGSSIGIDKIFQKQLLQQSGFKVPLSQVISYQKWVQPTDKGELLEELIAAVGFPFVVKSPCQGSSIGVSIVRNKDVSEFISAVNSSFFIEELTAKQWQQFTPTTKGEWLASLIDLREGIGLPVMVKGEIIRHPDELLRYLNSHFQQSTAILQLVSTQSEDAIILEQFISGREFSCIVLEVTPGAPIALPPTEMLKGDMHFDYRAKYLPGIVRKQTPMDLPLEQIGKIREQCARFFKMASCSVYARIDGFITDDYTIYLNDPNTTAGMNPSSFLFHQAATIGLNPTQLLTFLICTSLAERTRSGKVNEDAVQLLQYLDQCIDKE